MTLLVYSEQYLLHNNEGHPENAERLKAIISYIKEQPFYEKLNLILPEYAPYDSISAVHSESMIERAKKIGWLDPDTYTNEHTYNVAMLAAGGVLKACREILEGKDINGFAAVRPPGHHATRDKSMGFCIFNNVAIAANWLAGKGKKVLIFDHDVHHGNGTQDIFYDRDDVMYMSFHLSPHYPGTGAIEEVGARNGEGYTINAPLSHGAGEKCVKNLFSSIFIPIAEEFKPDFILFSAGFDSHYSDILGGLNLGIDFYGDIIQEFANIQKKMVASLEGGYVKDVLARGVAKEISTMLGTPLDFDDRGDGRDCDEVIKKLRIKLKDYWNI